MNLRDDFASPLPCAFLEGQDDDELFRLATVPELLALEGHRCKVFPERPFDDVKGVRVPCGRPPVKVARNGQDRLGWRVDGLRLRTDINTIGLDVRGGRSRRLATADSPYSRTCP